MKLEEKAQEVKDFMNFYSLNSEKATKIVELRERLDNQCQAMSKKEILAYAKQIRPVLPVNAQGKPCITELPGECKLYWLKSTRIKSTSCTHTPKIIREAIGLKEVARITTYHDYGGYYGFLRPSADEAIWQCPKDILDKVCAFEFYTPTLEVRFIYDSKLDKHKITTIYYEGELPEDIKNVPVKW